MPPQRNQVIHGDCIEEMRKMEENSVDAVVTDPPYGLNFMGRTWDDFEPKEYQEFCEEWGREALRVLKPGAYLLAFSGTRTYHRMVTGLEDAGFDIRNQISWMYGTGFPKNHNFSKDLEGEKAEKWDGFGTALKPSHEPVVLAQKPREGTYSNNVEKHGVGGLNIDRCRVGAESRPLRVPGKKSGFGDVGVSAGSKAVGTTNQGRWPANTVLTHSPDCRRVGTRKVEGDSREGGDGERPGGFVDTGADKGSGEPNSGLYGDENGDEEVEAWRCAPGCPVRLLDEQYGVKRAGGTPEKRNSDKFRNTYGEFEGHKVEGDGIGSSKGGASRFFYSAKAHKSERNAGLEDLEEVNFGQSGGARQALKNGEDSYQEGDDVSVGLNKVKKVKNDIATLKPINLIRWLVRLVTPPNGVVLDPFAGSGTTGCAAAIEGKDYILIEKRERFAEVIAPLRTEHWSNPENWSDLKQHNALPDKDDVMKVGGEVEETTLNDY